MSKEQGERFQQHIHIREEHYQGRWILNFLAGAWNKIELFDLLNRCVVEEPLKSFRQLK